jgi:hypothetical protein
LYFEVKAHIGVDSQTKVILTATPANVRDSMCLPDLLSFGGNALGRFIYLAIFINTINRDKTDLRRIKGEQTQAAFYAGRTPSLASASSARASGLHIT